MIDSPAIGFASAIQGEFAVALKLANSEAAYLRSDGPPRRGNECICARFRAGRSPRESWRAARFNALRNGREQIIIDGTCSSACTLVLGIVPRDRICVTQHAMLGFHAAWRPGFLGFKVINEPATRTLLSFYPEPIRQWIVRNGGLGIEMMDLSGPELMGIYRECR
jgi:hypothetical protein